MTNIETMIKDTLTPHPEIRLAIIFGSLAAGQEHQDSDVDLAIDAGRLLEIKTKMSLMEQLAECTGATSRLNDFKDFAKAVIQKCGL